MEAHSNQAQLNGTGTDLSGLHSSVCTILGAQWGDEGKGKLVDILSNTYSLVARFNGGSNAGHTLVVNGRKFAFHLLPCGLLYNSTINIIGNGVVLHVPTLLNELESLHSANVKTGGRLLISDRAHLLFDIHMLIDGSLETSHKQGGIGTTRKGIGPCYSSKAQRNGLRVGDLRNWDEFQEKYTTLVQALCKQFSVEYNALEELERYKQYRAVLLPMIADTSFYVNQSLKQGTKLLTEGANAAMLDLDHGTYPFVTSSCTTVGGVCQGLGLAPSKLQTVIGVVKAYTTRVGSGPFPTELFDEVGDMLRRDGGEFGTTTGRPRRCGWLDLVVVQYSHMINNYTSINLTKLDVLTGHEKIQLAVAYELNGKQLAAGQMPASLSELAAVKVVYETMEGWSEDISKCRCVSELPVAAQRYVKRIEEVVGVPVSWIGVGPGRNEMATQGFKAK